MTPVPGMLPDDLLPYIDIAGDARFAIGLPLLASEENQERRGFAKRRSGRRAIGASITKCFIEMTEPRPLGEVRLLRLVDAGKGVKIRGHPTPVLRHQMCDEIARRFRA